MNLPQTIQAYFEADRKNNCEALIGCFASDAIVRDEGRSHSGHDAIGRWWEEAKGRYRHVAEPLEANGDDQITRVRAKVSGEFPGSPVMLTFAFSLAGERIAALEVGA